MKQKETYKGFEQGPIRPPSESGSLLIRVTMNCPWNRCTFCEMYTQPQKRFRLKPQAEIEQELEAVARTGTAVRRIFLADGDAMTLMDTYPPHRITFVRGEGTELFDPATGAVVTLPEDWTRERSASPLAVLLVLDVALMADLAARASRGSAAMLSAVC